MRGVGLSFLLIMCVGSVACGDDGDTANTSSGAGTDTGASDSGTESTGTSAGSGSGGGTTAGPTGSGSGGSSAGTSAGTTAVTTGDTSGSSGGGGSSGTGGSTGGSTGGGSTGGLGDIMCPTVFPEFDDSCSGDDDCIAVVHTTDCCGNSVALGINASEKSDFDAAEAICDSQYPGCGCPSGPTVADDGCSAWDPNDLAATCDNGTCRTFVMGGC